MEENGRLGRTVEGREREDQGRWAGKMEICPVISSPALTSSSRSVVKPPKLVLCFGKGVRVKRGSEIAQPRQNFSISTEEVADTGALPLGAGPPYSTPRWTDMSVIEQLGVSLLGTDPPRAPIVGGSSLDETPSLTSAGTGCPGTATPRRSS
jgi:hypothetical protein